MYCRVLLGKTDLIRLALYLWYGRLFRLIKGRMPGFNELRKILSMSEYHQDYALAIEVLMTRVITRAVPNV